MVICGQKGCNMMSDPTEKTYAEEMKEHFTAVLILFAIGIAIWLFTDVLGIFKTDDRTHTKREPTQAEIDQWRREYHDNGGTDPDIDVSEQYGGK